MYINRHHSLGKFSRRQIYDIFLIFPENWLWDLMQIVSNDANILGKNKKKNFKMSSAENFTQHAQCSQFKWQVQEEVLRLISVVVCGHSWLNADPLNIWKNKENSVFILIFWQTCLSQQCRHWSNCSFRSDLGLHCLLFRYHHLGTSTGTKWNEPQLQNTYLWTCVPSENSDQPAHSHSLIRIFTGHILDS